LFQLASHLLADNVSAVNIGFRLCRMQELLSPTSYIVGMDLGDKVAVVTDGRLSGGTAGACIGHVSPEAAEGGPIALLKKLIRICFLVSIVRNCRNAVIAAMRLLPQCG
jgi:hypothetical protein